MRVPVNKTKQIMQFVQKSNTPLQNVAGMTGQRVSMILRFSRKRAPDRPPPWARGRRARVCDHPELGVDAPSAPACIRERSRALPVCDHLRQARQTTLGESGVAKLAECNLEVGEQQFTVFI